MALMSYLHQEQDVFLLLPFFPQHSKALYEQLLPILAAYCCRLTIIRILSKVYTWQIKCFKKLSTEAIIIKGTTPSNTSLL